MTVDEIIKKYEPKEENILSMLHDIQNFNPKNYLEKESLKKVADYLKIPLSRVNGVVGFYSMLSKEPRGKYVIRLCQSPPCFIKGSTNILQVLKKQLELNINETTKDGLFTLEFSSCLGVCGIAPVMSINNEIYGNLTEKKVIEIIENYKIGEV